MSEAKGESTMGVKLDAETRERLKALGQVRERSAHYLAVDAIKRYLDEEEEYEMRKREDMAAWEEYLRTGEAIPGEKVVAWLREMAEQRKYIEWHE